MFQFVTVTHPDEIKDRQRQKKLREHAIRSGIQRSKAKKLKDKGDVVACHVKDGVKEHEEGVREESARVALTRTPSISLLDPFDTITRPSGRLRGVRLRKSYSSHLQRS